MKTTLKSKVLPNDAYLALVIRHPLRPVRTQAEYNTGAQMLMELSERAERGDLDSSERDYLDVLAGLLEAYDRTKGHFDLPAGTPVEVLKHLMEANDLRPSDLGDLLGSRGVATDILKGRRALSKSHVRKLAERFHIDAGVFL